MPMERSPNSDGHDPRYPDVHGPRLRSTAQSRKRLQLGAEYIQRPSCPLAENKSSPQNDAA